MKTPPITILVAEDEKDIRDLIVLHMKREGYATEEVDTGIKALQKLKSGTAYDLLILDWMLPEMNGIDLLKAIKSEQSGNEKLKNMPVLFVTARIETADIVLGLESGADDYIPKPFDIPVLLARTRALLRRRKQLSSTKEVERVKIGDLTVDLGAHEATMQGQAIALTHSEFKLLAALAKNQGRVLTRDKLIELVQGEGVSVVDRAIDTHVFGLRKKLEPYSDLIETVRGVGYRIKGAEST